MENNVFHYFENRVNKIIKGKRDYLTLISKTKEIGTYQIYNNDAKNIGLKNNSIDMVFTDFPYGDTVPYFEQSQLWNSWLKNKVDYKNEIVISNSEERRKGKKEFEIDIESSINEIVRVLKNDHYFIFTYHSLDGNEWMAINNAITKNSLVFQDCKLMLQKTFTPRQLNRKITIKGDMIVIYKKNKNKKIRSGRIEFKDLKDINLIISNELKKDCNIKDKYTTNDLISKCVKILLKQEHITNNVNFKDIIEENFYIGNENLWRLK